MARQTTDCPRRSRATPALAVETFFEKAAAARLRLEAVIVAAQARRDHAIAAQVRNRAIAQDADREIAEIRAEAEEQAAEIISAARLEAQRVLSARGASRHCRNPTRSHSTTTSRRHRSWCRLPVSATTT